MSSEKVPTVQSVWRVMRRGHPSKVLQLVHDAPVGADIKDNEVLVRVEAAALNPVGFKLMKMVPDFMAKRPHTSEYDFSGVIAGTNSTNYAIGDRVFGVVPIEWQFKEHEGALCQYTRVPDMCLGRLPDRLSFEEGAGVALTALTAHDAFFNIFKIQTGQTVLIYGASTSVGMYAVQIAKARGCKVWATASGANEALVRGLGADEFLDYTQAPVHQALKRSSPTPHFDVILDAFGLTDSSLFTHSEAYLAPNGVFLSVSFQPKLGLKNLAMTLRAVWSVFLHPVWLGGTNRKHKVFILKPKKADIDAVASMLDEGVIKPVVDSVFAFKDTLKAYDRLMSGRAKGKVTVKVNTQDDK